MELRSCSHLHFVKSLQGGMVTKVLNLSRGRPALKFRVVKDLYESENTKRFEVNPAFWPKFECVDLPFECDGEKAESLCNLTGEEQKSDDETSESKRQANAAEGSRLCDFNFANITLKQIKERCKEKKRKRSKVVNKSKETTKTHSLRANSNFSSQSEDEYDTMEPLICWKSRILKKKKNKRNCKMKIVYASSHNSLSTTNFEEKSTEFICQTEENSPSPIAIKVEFPEPTFSDCQALAVTFPESPLKCIEPVVYYGAVSSEGLKKADGFDLETRAFSIDTHIAEHLLMRPAIPDEELMTDSCGFEIHMPTYFSYAPQTSVVNEESYEELCEKFVSETAISVEDFTTETYRYETQVPALLTNEPHFCADNNDSYENEDYVDGYDIQGSGGKKLTDTAEAVRGQFPHLSLLEAEKEHCVTEQHQINNFQVVLSPTEAVLCNDLQNFASTCMMSQKTNSNSEVQAPDVINDDTHEVKEPRQGNVDNEADAHNHVQARITDSPARDYGSLWNSNMILTPNCSSGSGVDCHDESVVNKGDQSHHSEGQHPPERLLSTRMAISPASQKKLREEAMEANELDHEKYYKLARKLCYGNLIENKTGRLEGGIQIKKAEVITSPKKAVRKSKTDSIGFHHNDNTKVHHASRVQCNSVRSCPESAILFSQQQLRDTESITTRLAKQLKFLKDIAEETLQYPGASLRYSQDEIKIAIRNATRTEESAKRSLSIMARDCSRFCKIMKLAEKSSRTSSSTEGKKRKIVFADEAGGKLCEFKTFKSDMQCE